MRTIDEKNYKQIKKNKKSFCWKILSMEDRKKLKYMTIYQKHLTEAGKTY